MSGGKGLTESHLSTLGESDEPRKSMESALRIALPTSQYHQVTPRSVRTLLCNAAMFEFA